ncbi:hypothetical protein KI387_038247, partial [Taxus chinensis]
QIQPFDYENTAFRCQIFRNPGHLQASCPLNKNTKNVKKGTSGWGNMISDLVSGTTFKEDPSKVNNKIGVEKIVKETTNNKEVAGGTKRGHSPRKSKSESDNLSNSMEARDKNNLMMVITADQGKWQEVSKRKGKKGWIANISDYFPSQGGK